MLNILPSILVLGLAAFAALLLALNLRSPPERVAERLAAARALALAVGVQSVHFGEEVVTGFHEQLGALLGLPGMPLSGFVVFNLTWLGIWVPRFRDCGRRERPRSSPPGSSPSLGSSTALRIRSWPLPPVGTSPAWSVRPSSVSRASGSCSDSTRQPDQREVQFVW